MMKYNKIRKGSGYALMLTAIISLVILLGACNSFGGGSIEGEWLFHRVNNFELESDDSELPDKQNQEATEVAEKLAAAMAETFATGRKIEFNDENSFVETQLGIAIAGKYEINNGSELVLKYDQYKKKEEDRYKFKIDGDSLYLTPILRSKSPIQFQLVFARFK